MRVGLFVPPYGVKKQLVCLMASALFLIFIYPKTGLDQQLIAPYFNTINHQFALKHSWFLKA